jgi:hypothetical protein
MKKLLSSVFFVSVVLTSCGPAAEDRKQMDRVAKRMSDSLQNLIDSSLSDPSRHINFNPQPQPVAVPSNTAPANK